MRVRIDYTHHLVNLVARVEAAAARLELADPGRRAEVAAAASRAQARASVKLDASPLQDATADRVDARWVDEGVLPDSPEVPMAAEAAHRTDGWAAALKLDGLPTQDIAAREYAGVLRAHALEAELVDLVVRDPLAAFARLHAALTAGLIEGGPPPAAGAVLVGLRRTQQAIHDGGAGSMIFVPPPPHRLPALLDGLAGWLSASAWNLPGVIAAGVVHERLLEWQPFEAASGRLARAATRLLLRARGTDAEGLGAWAVQLVDDATGYHREVAATMRRGGDPVGWLERHTAAVAWSLEEAARLTEGGTPDTMPGDRASDDPVVALPPGTPIAVDEHARVLGVHPAAAYHDLSARERAGQVRAVPGTRGLRYVRV